MTYKPYSQTTSGWSISTDPKAEKARRWRAVHPEFGERFYATHDEVLPDVAKHYFERVEKAMKLLKLDEMMKKGPWGR